MKSYVKTKWVDGETPVNAANLGKLENAISEISKDYIGVGNLKSGDGIEIKTTQSDIVINTTGGVMKSSTIGGFEIINDPLENNFKENILYLYINPETSKLISIHLNGLIIYEVG